MGLASWVRDRLWRANNWCAELAQIRHELATEPRSATTPERIFDLASASEQCDPDRGRAMALYLDAWRAGHDAARAPAKALAIALSSHMALAEIAVAEGDLVTAGTAFLDAGFPDLAVEPLEKFVAARPPGASPATETLRLDGVSALLALARRSRFDAEREIANTLSRAKEVTGRAAAAAAFLHAARIAKLARLDDDRVAFIVNTAARACPDDDAIATLVETRLYELGNTERLIDHYRARLDRSTSPAQHAERARAAGIELIARNVQPGLGLRLLRISLEHAYAANTPDVASHVATWELLVTHARAQRSTLDLVPLLVEAVGAVLSKDVAVYLARLGLEIAWRDASDTLAAQPYAAMLLDYVPDHPLATAFAHTVSPATGPASDPPATPPPASAPQPPVTPPCASASPPATESRPTTAAPSWQSPATTTSRIPVIPQGQVKRATTSSGSERVLTSRLALLKPPPPRSTSLKRDTSPFPIAPQPATPAAPRAARKVVPIDVLVELPSGGFFSTLLRDVSTSGAFIVTKRALEVDSVVALEMQIPARGTLRQSSFRANARIVRRTDTGYGLAFVDPSSDLVAALAAAIE